MICDNVDVLKVGILSIIREGAGRGKGRGGGEEAGGAAHCLWHSLSASSFSQVVGGLPEDSPDAPDIPTVQGHQLLGGPQMLQLR